MEHIEEAGVHSGDSACSLPPYSLKPETIAELKKQTAEMAFALGVRGLMNVQFAIEEPHSDEPRIFAEIQKAGDVPDLEMENVFNLGLGMLAVVAEDSAERALDVVRAEGHDAWIVGDVVEGHGRARVETR